MPLLLAALVACGGTEEHAADDVDAGDGGLVSDAVLDATSAPETGSVPDTVTVPETASAPDSAPDTAQPFPGPTADNCIKDVTAGKHTYDCDGLVFNVALPPACLTAACALVFDVHGLTMSAQMQEKNTAMAALAGKYNAIVVQPNAKPAPPMSSWSPSDDGKVLAFLNRMRKVFHTDDKRIHFTGFSQGGDMTWRMLCKHAGLFASVAPAAFSSGCFIGGDKPSVTVPLLYMHGNKDVLQPLSGADKMRQAIITAWKLGAPSTVSADNKHEWTRRKAPDGTVVEFIGHNYSAASPVLGGHCYPGSSDLQPSAPGQLMGYGCVGKSAFAWGEAVMTFFAAHPKQ